MAVWSLQFVVTGNDLSELQPQILGQAKTIVAFLKKRGFAEEEISVSPITTNDLYANPYQNTAETNGRRFILTQSVELQTNKVDAVADALTASNELIAGGIVFSQDYGGGSRVSYLFTKLNDIKPEMLEEATRNAKEAALQFAKTAAARSAKSAAPARACSRYSRKWTLLICRKTDRSTRRCGWFPPSNTG